MTTGGAFVSVDWHDSLLGYWINGKVLTLKRDSTETKRKAFDFNGFLSKLDRLEGKAAPKGLNKPALRPFWPVIGRTALSKGLPLLTALAF